MPLLGVSVMPPTVVSSVKRTRWPATGPPALLSTWEQTAEVSFRPVPLRPIVVGVADTNTIVEAADAATAMLPVADSDVPSGAVANAVIGSLPVHPLAE